METRTFNEIRRIVYERSGITLSSAKMAMVSARLGKRMRALNIPDAERYVEALKNGKNEEELTHFIDAMSTNVTNFYRESDHFDFMREALSRWAAAGQREFNFWSAACSSGEEPFTMAIVAHEVLKPFNPRIRILATDISTRVLALCKEAIYAPDKLGDIPPNVKARYFEKITMDNGDTAYQIVPEIRSIITFSRINLSTTPFPMKGPMDIIFIRNVMIYFDDSVRKRLLAEASRLLKPGGYLMVGHSEGLTGLVSDLQLVKPAVYSRAA